jgi:hypothetical protein
MSERAEFDLRAELARIDRDRAETHKLTAESQKFVAEQYKLMAEGQKLTRDRWLAPVIAVASVLAAIGGVTGGAIIVAKQAGWLP